MPRPELTTAAVVALITGVWFAALQAADPRLADYDAWFHIRYAWLLRQHGPWMDFPWMPHTFFAEGWVDHQFLYHVLLVPFTYVSDLRVGAKASAVAFSTLAVTVFSVVLHRRQVRWPVLWALVLLAGSRFFVVRMLMPRTQALSLALLLAGWLLAVERRGRALAVLGVAYGWTYHVAAMLVPTALSTALPPDPGGHDRVRWAPVAIAALAVAAGLVLTPYFPRTVTYFWLHAVEKVSNQGGLEVGAEWFPINSRLLLLHTAPALGVGLLAIGAALMRGVKARRDTLSALILAVGWTGLALWSQKWIEMAVPFALLASALLARDAGLHPGWLLWAPIVMLWNGQQAVQHVRDTVPAPDRLATIGAALEASPGAVFHPDWTDFSELFYYAPSCTFTVGLDPTFLASADPARYRLIDAMLDGKVPDISGAAKAGWQADWVVLTSAPLRTIAAEDPGLELVIDDGESTLWRVR